MLTDHFWSASIPHCRTALSGDPIEKILAPARNRQDKTRRRGIGMEPFDVFQNLAGPLRRRLDDHRRFRVFLNPVFPDIDRRHRRKDIDASRDLGLHKRASGFFCIVEGWKSSVNQHRRIIMPGLVDLPVVILFLCLDRRVIQIIIHYGFSMASEHPTIVEKIAFVASDTPEAEQALQALSARYGNAAPEEAGVIVALGGDGLMLQTLHQYMDSDIPIYGMNRGSVGFLMNEYREEDLPERLACAKLNRIYPLRMHAKFRDGTHRQALAINEVSLFRLTHQAARLRISVDGEIRLEELICDGVLVATPAGSTAYNLSVHGPILPISASLLALTPISPFRPRRWRGALLPGSARVAVDVLEAQKRPVSAVADHTEFREIEHVEISEERGIGLRLLFDPGHELDDRVLAEQFRY